MSWLLLSANVLTVLAFVAHTFVGDSELHVLMDGQANATRQYRSTWTMARCGWHWISTDLLAASALLFCINFYDFLPHEEAIVLVLGVFFVAYALIWFVTILLSPRFKRRFFLLGQWALLLVIGGLLLLAI